MATTARLTTSPIHQTAIREVTPTSLIASGVMPLGTGTRKARTRRPGPRNSQIFLHHPLISCFIRFFSFERVDMK